MSFTEEETAALDALEKVFGEHPADIAHVSQHVPSADYVKGNVRGTLSWWADFKLKQGIDFDEIDRLKREARDNALAERAQGVRESIVLGFLSGLLPKINRDLPDSEVEFYTSPEGFELQASGWKYTIALDYNRETFALKTSIFSEGIDVIDLSEDLTLVSGNTRPRDQVKGLEAVHEFLDGLAEHVGA